MLGRWFGRRRTGNAAAWDLGTTLLRWSEHDVWTIRDAVEGTCILGSTGSGKTTGSGAAIARAMLDAGFGGLVLTVKKDERAVWESYCRQAGREKDLVVFSPSQPWRFNFLDDELRRSGEGAGLTENVVGLFSTVLEIAGRNASGGGGREDEGYWKRSSRQLIRNIVDLQSLATGRLSVPDLYRLVVSMPTSPEQVRSESWRAESLCFALLRAADRRPKTAVQRADLEVVTDYMLLEYPALSDKTRSVIVSTFTSMIDILNRGILRTLFSSETNLTPQAVEEGRIVLMDLPVKEFAETGQFAQVLWKHAFQRAIERRDVERNARPVFLWADEAQHFVTSYDFMFQTTCRAARVATVLLSQNVSTFEAALGGNEKGKAETASLLGNLNTKLFHGQSDPATNQWAATLLGRTLQSFANGSNSYGQEEWIASALGIGQTGQTSAGFSETYEFEVQPSVFSGLRTGGPDNNRCVEAILFQNGRRFKATGRSWMPVTFKQQ